MRNSIGITGQDERTVNRKREASLKRQPERPTGRCLARVNGSALDKHVKGHIFDVDVELRACS